uniref:Uncharacterized protein n=1 Tax=Sphaerodactylus townsendi TaxID=933632 RepID=A0ACB8FUC7_9SAUR
MGCTLSVKMTDFEKEKASDTKTIKVVSIKETADCKCTRSLSDAEEKVNIGAKDEDCSSTVTLDSETGGTEKDVEVTGAEATKGI